MYSTLAKFGAWCCALLIGASGFAAAAKAEHDGAFEYKLKAAFIYNFTKFVQWPARAFGPERPALLICAFGDNPFGSALDPLVGRIVGGRPVAVQRLADLESIQNCHVLYVSRSHQLMLPRVLEAVSGRNILTITDVPRADEQGVIINLVTVDDRIRFVINRTAAERADLRVSAHLLRLAVASAERAAR